MMKKLIFLAVTSLLLVCMAACGNGQDDSKLRKSIEEAQSELPVDLGLVGDMTDLKYDRDDRNVRMFMTVNENIVNVAVMKENSDSFRNMFKLMWTGEDTRELIEMIADAGASMSVRYKGGTSGESVELKLSNSELKEILDTKLTEKEKNRMLLEGTVANGNAACPMNIGNGMIMESVTLEGNNVVYAIEVDEEISDMELLRINEDMIREEMVKQFGNPVVANELNIMASAGCAVVYRYIGDTSGDTFEIRFSNRELKNY